MYFIRCLRQDITCAVLLFPPGKLVALCDLTHNEVCICGIRSWVCVDCTANFSTCTADLSTDGMASAAGANLRSSVSHPACRHCRRYGCLSNLLCRETAGFPAMVVKLSRTFGCSSVSRGRLSVTNDAMRSTALHRIGAPPTGSSDCYRSLQWVSCREITAAQRQSSMSVQLR